MRDLLLLGLFPVLVFYAIRKPFIGLSLWLWTSLVPIQTWSFGMATSIRWNLIFAACTMLGYIFMKNKPKVHLGPIFVFMCIFVVLVTLSCLTHNGYDEHIWVRYEGYLKAFLFFIFVSLIVDKRLHFEALAWACVLSVTASAAKQGIKVALSGGGHAVYGISSTFNDNNLSAFATLVCIPLTVFLIARYKHIFILKWGLIGSILISVLFVFGSDSRGGFLGLLVLGAFFFYKSKSKLPIAFGMVCIGAIALSIMDQSWFDRMGTIDDMSEDGSFMGRVVAWKLNILMAMKNPMLGGGFDAAAYGPNYLYLMQYWGTLDWIETPYPTTLHVAHSIYFQVLGDFGFLGFFVFFGLIFSSFRIFAARSKTSQVVWIKDFGTFAMLATVSFFVAGAALSVAYNEITLMLLAVSGILGKVEKQEIFLKTKVPEPYKDRR